MSDLVTEKRARFLRAALALIETRKSEHTRRAYKADLERWLGFANALGVDVECPSIEAATHFREHLLTVLSPESTHRPLAALSFLYRRLLAAGAANSNVFHPAILAWPKVSHIGKTLAVEAAAAERMIALAASDTDSKRGRHDVAILRLLYDTGLRRASVAGLRRAAIEHHNGRMTIRVVVKGGGEARAELPATTATALTDWLEVAPDSPWVFPARGGGARHPTTLNKIIARRAEAAGCGHVHPHCFRAAFVTAAYDAGLPEYEIQRAAHHAKPETTRRYDRGARGTTVADAVAKHREKRK
jgi:integrase